MSGVSLSILNQPAAATPRKGKLRQQLDGERTRRQLVFDCAFGVVLPVLCFVFDPLFFRDGFLGGGRGIFEDFRFFAYVVAAVEILTLTIWLTLGKRTGERRVALGSVMLAGFLFSLFIGIILLPFSIIGLAFIIGILGFAPFFSAFVFLRNGWRALDAVAGSPMNRRRLVAPLALGAIVVLGLPALIQWQLSNTAARAADEVIRGRASSEATRTLRYTNWLTDAGLERIVIAYQAERDMTRRAELERTYRQITGENIEARWRGFFD